MISDRFEPGHHLRLLYLGFAFPPGIAPLYPELNPAGHALETQMISQLRERFEIRSTGVLPFQPPRLDAADPASGLTHDLMLLERPPELFTRWSSLSRLKAQYRQWERVGWKPDLVLVYNLSPIYNQFLTWLRGRPDCPKLVLLLLDSPNLGQELPWLKRVRRRLKPMCIPDSEMLGRFDACIGLSRTAEAYFRPAAIPFLWMPGGCLPSRALKLDPDADESPTPGPLRVGYFGALGPHAGIQQMAGILHDQDLEVQLEICGYGKAAGKFAEMAAQDERIKFRGLLSPAECLRFGRACDVLVNPRPDTHGNRNNFASKLFEYALTGRAILTSNLAGADTVLGRDAFYFDPQDFQAGLLQRLLEITRIPREELNRRGAAIQQRVTANYSWPRQVARMAEFLEQVWAGRRADALLPALAA